MTSSTGTVVFNDAKLQAIDVVATERLGVGTLDPASNLHVVGNVHVTGNVNKLNFTDGYTIKRGANVTVFGTTDVIQEITGPHARHVVPLRKYPEVAMTAAITSGYTTEASSQLNSAFPSWNAFNGVVETVNNGGGEWISGTDTYDTSATNGAYLAHSSNSVLFEGQRGEYLGIILPSAIKLDYINVYGRFDTTDSRTVREYILWGSNDGSSWTQLQTGTNTLAAVSSTNLFVVPVRATNFYSRFRLQALSMNTNAGEVSIGEMQLYGYEETSDPDTSVDTKITSQFNLPDTTGVKLYVDGDKGSTATDFSGEGHTLTENNATYDSAEKAWEFSSLSTSNVTMTSGDLAMEGTHPHSVSLWFNAANVSSNATLFHVGTAAGEGDAKTAISLTESGHLGWIDGGDNQFLSANTWHNLVYATQGGGGVRTCYLDGRKLGDVSVQDTFGEYPPFAMTGYSQGGYTVSASSEYGSAYLAHEAFNGTFADNGDCWLSTNAVYDGTTGNYNGSANLGSGVDDGEWLKLEMPHKFVLDYITICGSTATGVNPKDWKIYGSNDDKNWDVLLSKTNAVTAAYNASSGKEHIVGASKAYQYFALVVTKSGGLTGGTHYIQVGELEFYGHKENDTTRFPVSSTVLKYPHIAMTGPAQRGYVATVSSTYSLAYDGHYALNEIISPSNQTYSYWSCANHYTSSGAWDSTYNTDTYKTTASGTDYYGDFIEVEFPRKITLSYITIHAVTTAQNMVNRLPSDGVVAGWNGSSWEAITTYIDFSVSASTHNILNINASTAYSKIRLVVTSLQKNVSLEYEAIAIDILRFYGTEPEDVVTRVGEGLDGKVANFRVYGKYLREEQALELWDAQKDQFGRAESSVVVHKGRLGVGTTEPEGRFAVLDEAHESEEFPPRAMTAAETYMEGHGVFKVSASSNGFTPSYTIWKAFDKTVDGLGWHDQSDPYTDGVYSGTRSLDGISGEWIALKLPYKINLKSVAIAPRSGATLSQRSAGSGVILGSNDEVNWDQLHSFSDLTATDYEFTNINNIIAPGYYKTIAIVVTELVGKPPTININSLNISEIKFFGTREQGQSTLHDGQLTLTKNLTVPRIGPALDADDTPRRDRLVVEYNTSTNPTANGTVKDTSGRGVDGLMYNGAYYDATEKALVFDGTDDYVSMSDWKYNTGFIHSFSGWIKFKSPEESWNVVYGVGDAAGTSRTNFTIWSKTDDSYFRTEADGSGSYIDHTFEFTGNMNKWLHMAVVKSSARIDSTRIYINGVLLPQTGATLADRDIALPNTPQNFNLNGYGPTGGNNGNVNLSNVKFYDTALAADEVKRLYDMGRCDEGHHVVNFSKTRVGIGLGDGEAPTYTLDVRGQIRSQGSLVTSFTGQHKCVPENGEPVEKGLIVSATKNKYVKLNGSLDTGKKAITIDESLPVVSLSNVAQDKACFGVVSSTEEANTVYRIETTNGGVISHIPKTLGDNRVIVNSVGEGAIWVCDANGPLESGDYITTSNVAGYGQKQTGEFLANYTVAKITMDCDFTGSNVAVQAIKKVETLKTVTEDVWQGLSDYDRSSNTETQYINESNVVLSIEEYESLASEEQNTYSETTIQTYYRIQRGENVLDEHGMLQWEDTGATEPGYELRYLDATGQQTDEANCVHRAAFVGCTYHCG
jgi:hypothetical protein